MVHNQTVHPLVEARRDEIAALCRRLGVRRLDVFGSAASGDFDVDRSDVDVLVEFDAGARGGIALYFALKDGLEQLLGRPVDVVSARSVRNPYVEAGIRATRERLYAA